jgi:hypothetical protein
MSLADIAEAQTLTESMQRHAVAGDWEDVVRLEQERAAVLQRLACLEPGSLRPGAAEYEPMRALQASNEALRLLCERARDDLRDSMQVARRGQSAVRAYAGR